MQRGHMPCSLSFTDPQNGQTYFPRNPSRIASAPPAGDNAAERELESGLCDTSTLGADNGDRLTKVSIIPGDTGDCQWFAQCPERGPGRRIHHEGIKGERPTKRFRTRAAYPLHFTFAFTPFVEISKILATVSGFRRPLSAAKSAKQPRAPKNQSGPNFFTLLALLATWRSWRGKSSITALRG